MQMSAIFLTLGSLLVLGLLLTSLSHRMHVPRVSLLILFGFIIGPGALNIIPNTLAPWFPVLTNMALAMIGFLIGGKLSSKTLHLYGRSVFIISVTISMLTILIVCLGLFLINIPLSIAVLLAVIASATAPATTTDIIHELRDKTAFSKILLGIVAIDEMWVLFLFSFAFILVDALTGSQNINNVLLTASWNIFGALLIGIIIGIPSAFLTGKIKAGEPMMIEALGIVFIAAGLAFYLKASFLLTTMILGFVITNMAKHHKRPFHAIENIDAPFLIIFFILAGASLHLKAIHQFGLFALAYIILRILAVIIGGWCGGSLSKSTPQIKKWIGLALLPQAGVVIGMALIASQAFPEIASIILPTVLIATICFELMGPLMTRLAILKARKKH